MTDITTTKRAHISSQFPDQEHWDIYESLTLDLLRKTICNDTLHTKFRRVTNIRKQPVNVMLDALYGFAEKYNLLGVDTDGLQ